MFEIFTAFGLSAAAGLNAYLPLLVVGLLARYTDLISLSAPWDALENPWVLGVLVVLLLIEMTVDKFPMADTVNDVLQTFVRPVAGAILFAASASVITDIHPVLALICGILAAGAVHSVKATARPVVTATTGGLGNPVVSLAEDVAALTISLLAIILPALTAAAIVVVLIWAWRKYRRRRMAKLAGRRSGEINRRFRR
ncbi:MAG: DUF4126 domain-containing protein [Caldilineales bacterium]|nr:DUF4126 domain-containing protein [Caldilineales bacterium]